MFLNEVMPMEFIEGPEWALYFATQLANNRGHGSIPGIASIVENNIADKHIDHNPTAVSRNYVRSL